MIGNPIPDEQHIARYCRPTQNDEGMPSVSAFHLRPEDKGQLSVNWMEFFSPNKLAVSKDHRKQVIERIRAVIQMDKSSNGLFAVLNVGLARQAIIDGGGHSPKVWSTPQPAKPAQGKKPARGPDPSHASMSGYTVDDNLDVAVQLLALVGPDQVFPGFRLLVDGRPL